MKGVGARIVRASFASSGIAAVLVAMAPAAPAQTPAPFTEEAVARGIDYLVYEIPGLPHGYGVAFADLDRDGDPDAVLTGGATGTVGVYENDGTGNFVDRSAGSGLPLLMNPSGVVAFDYDADGDLDLYLSLYLGTLSNVLAENLGGFRFDDVSTAAGVDDPGPGSGATVGDYDGDGWLDLHVPNYDGVDRLYHNLGNGSFAEVALQMGVADPWRGLQAVFFDMDWDGDADLYVSNDKKDVQETVMHNRLYENVGGTLVDVSASSGADVNAFSMGVAVGDFDANGLQDLYCTNLSVEPNPLLLCTQPGTYVRSETAAGVESNRLGWGSVFFDYDNDADLDLYVCNRSSVTASSANRLYANGAWPCPDVAPALAVDDAQDSFCVATADIDDDGDIDFMIQNNDDRVRLYVNHEGERRSWIKLRVLDTGANRFAIGARVSVRVGSTWQHREVLAGGNGYKGQNELTAHFGLDGAAEADEVVVRWPGGRRHQAFHLPAGSTYVVRPGSTVRTSRVPVPVTLAD